MLSTPQLFEITNPWSLKNSVKVKTLLTWDVGQHDDDEAVVVVERHVVLVGKPHGVHPGPAHKRQSGVNGEELSDDPQRVQDDEEVVSGEEKRGMYLKSRSVTHTQSHTSAVTGMLTHSHAWSNNPHPPPPPHTHTHFVAR